MVPILSAVALREGDEVVATGHRAVVVHDLADHAGRVEAGQAREIDRGLGMAGALQRAAVARDQREDVARRHDVVRPARRVDRDRRRCARGRPREMPVVTPSRASIDTVKAV